MTPVAARLSPELVALQQQWQGLPRAQQDEFYAREFAPAFASLFAELPLHGAPVSLDRPRALVSVLGFSWQPIALMAAWARPERLLLIGTRESLAIKVAGEDVVALVARIGGIDRERILTTQVGDPGESDIYRAVGDFVRTSGLNPREVFIDPTGGKKSMSASAALAGFLAGAPLVYVDYTTYANRIPLAGTEYPRLLTNPLEVFGELELRKIFSAFNRSDFAHAEQLAEALAERLYAPREAQVLAALAAGYAAWDRFAFETARDCLIRAQDMLNRFSTQGGWTWARGVEDQLSGNIHALTALGQVARDKEATSLEAGRPLLLWYVASAERLAAAGKTSLAVLLAYAAVERYIDLCLRTRFGLDDEKPDYAKLDGVLDRAAYHDAGRAFHGRSYEQRELKGPIMFTNGAQLLSALAPELLHSADFGALKGLSAARNKCEYEHGWLPKIPSQEDAARALTKAREVVARLFDSPEEMTTRLGEYRFPALGPTGASPSTA